MKLSRAWHERLAGEFSKPYIASLKAFLESEKQAGQLVYPPEPLVFHALSATAPQDVKVVIMGQDPYHGSGQAHGLSFSVPCGIPKPPSLQNIFKELESDLGLPLPNSGCLTSWARQGVLLLNATLTVRAGEPRSHYGKGWEIFTDRIVESLIEMEEPLVLMLWGKSAQEKIQKVLKPRDSLLVLSAPHPSPYSAHQGFLGCRHFSKANQHLEKWGKKPIDWVIS